MDYLKNAEKRIIDGRMLSFIRCDKDGNEIPADKLREINFTNPTIDKLVTETAVRMGVEVDENGIFGVGVNA